MKNIIILLFFIPLTSIAQENNKVNEGSSRFIDYYSNGEIHLEGKELNQILIDTLYGYYKNGKLHTIHIFSANTYPRKVYYFENLRGMRAETREGYFIQTDDITYVKDSIWKYYYKNGNIMDSVEYQNGEQIFRARFNKRGKRKF